MDRAGIQRRGGHHQLHGDLDAGLHLHDGTTSCTVTGLTNGTGYTFTVTATNAAGHQSPPRLLGRGHPGHHAERAHRGDRHLQRQHPVGGVLDRPASNGGAAITSYTATSGGPPELDPPTATTSCTVTGLTNGTSYTFTVTATNVAGTGAASAASAAGHAGHHPGRSHRRDRHLQRQHPVGGVLDGPASNGGAAITGYTATSSPGWLHLLDHPTSCTVTGLTNGTSYTFTVTATNSAGTSAASAPRPRPPRPPPRRARPG